MPSTSTPPEKDSLEDHVQDFKDIITMLANGFREAERDGQADNSKGCRKELLPEKLIFPPVLLCHIGISLIIIFINLLKRLLFITKSFT